MWIQLYILEYKIFIFVNIFKFMEHILTNKKTFINLKSELGKLKFELYILIDNDEYTEKINTSRKS